MVFSNRMLSRRDVNSEVISINDCLHLSKVDELSNLSHLVDVYKALVDLVVAVDDLSYGFGAILELPATHLVIYARMI